MKLFSKFSVCFTIENCQCRYLDLSVACKPTLPHRGWKNTQIHWGIPVLLSLASNRACNCLLESTFFLNICSFKLVSWLLRINTASIHGKWRQRGREQFQPCCQRKIRQKWQCKILNMVNTLFQMQEGKCNFKI